MRSNQQSGPDGNSGGADIGGQFLGGAGTGKNPWFGRKRFGWGYGPRTWQGYLVTALSLIAVIVTATVAKGSPWFYAVLIAVAAVHLAIIGIQRRR
jgi:hypothetical protein